MSIKKWYRIKHAPWILHQATLENVFFAYNTKTYRVDRPLTHRIDLDIIGWLF